jgi:structural maintenance of chromosome 1
LHDQALEEARTEQAKARTAVMQKEKRFKKVEKQLEAKV